MGKKISGKTYYYLRESRRENGKVKAITLAYLGKTKKEAEKKRKEIEDKLSREKIVRNSGGAEIMGKKDLKKQNLL